MQPVEITRVSEFTITPGTQPQFHSHAPHQQHAVDSSAITGARAFAEHLPQDERAAFLASVFCNLFTRASPMSPMPSPAPLATTPLGFASPPVASAPAQPSLSSRPSSASSVAGSAVPTTGRSSITAEAPVVPHQNLERPPTRRRLPLVTSTEEFAVPPRGRRFNNSDELDPDEEEEDDEDAADDDEPPGPPPERPRSRCGRPAALSGQAFLPPSMESSDESESHSRRGIPVPPPLPERPQTAAPGSRRSGITAQRSPQQHVRAGSRRSDSSQTQLQSQPETGRPHPESSGPQFGETRSSALPHTNSSRSSCTGDTPHSESRPSRTESVVNVAAGTSTAPPEAGSEVWREIQCLRARVSRLEELSRTEHAPAASEMPNQTENNENRQEPSGMAATVVAAQDIPDHHVLLHSEFEALLRMNEENLGFLSLVFHALRDLITDDASRVRVLRFFEELRNEAVRTRRPLSASGQPVRASQEPRGPPAAQASPQITQETLVSPSGPRYFMSSLQFQSPNTSNAAATPLRRSPNGGTGFSAQGAAYTGRQQQSEYERPPFAYGDLQQEYSRMLQQEAQYDRQNLWHSHSTAQVVPTPAVPLPQRTRAPPSPPQLHLQQAIQLQLEMLRSKFLTYQDVAAEQRKTLPYNSDAGFGPVFTPEILAALMNDLLPVLESCGIAPTEEGFIGCIHAALMKYENSEMSLRLNELIQDVFELLSDEAEYRQRQQGGLYPRSEVRDVS